VLYDPAVVTGRGLDLSFRGDRDEDARLLRASMALAMLLASGSAFRKPGDRGCKADS
jgi:hypothetical protein